MIKMQMTSIVSVLMLCLPGFAEAQSHATNQSPSVKSIYEDCKGRNLEFCNGYLLGVGKGLEMLHIYNLKVGETYCPAYAADATLYRQIFMKWAENSRFWNLNSQDGAVTAFLTEWFCQRGG